MFRMFLMCWFFFVFLFFIGLLFVVFVFGVFVVLGGSGLLWLCLFGSVMFGGFGLNGFVCGLVLMLLVSSVFVLVMLCCLEFRYLEFEFVLEFVLL